MQIGDRVTRGGERDLQESLRSRVEIMEPKCRAEAGDHGIGGRWGACSSNAERRFFVFPLDRQTMFQPRCSVLLYRDGLLMLFQFEIRLSTVLPISIAFPPTPP
ncbi:hypothetical protein NL676_017522 [Syzygium grande]|nr:hypothetical protein NL676_017522 [Syzygium grande]